MAWLKRLLRPCRRTQVVIWNLSSTKVTLKYRCTGSLVVDINPHHVFSPCLDSAQAVQLKNDHWAPITSTASVKWPSRATWAWINETHTHCWGPSDFRLELEDGRVLCQPYGSDASEPRYPVIYIIVGSNAVDCPVKVHPIVVYCNKKGIKDPLRLPNSLVQSPPEAIDW